IGRVVVLVNGKEKTDDARPRGAADASAATLELHLDLSNDPRVVPGRKNRVEVLAYGADGYLCSRGMVRDVDDTRPAVTEPPALRAVVVGISQSRGASLPLRYAAKDADAFAAALELAARRFYDPDKKHPNRVHITRLTAATGEARPTLTNLRKALD